MSDVDIIEDIKIDEKIKQNISEPKKHKVVLLNDDKTPMEWVIDILKTIFNHSQDTAEKLTLQIHNEGSGIAGIYNYEIAEQKAIETVNVSREHGFPLNVRIDSE
jgi:ATP-dependent Clp protease adaptor protein ClpS